MKAINILNFSVSTIIIVLSVLYMCFNGFSIGLAFIVALALIYAVFEMFAIVADFTNKEDVLRNYKIGSKVRIVGNLGAIEHYATIGEECEILSHYMTNAVKVQTLSEGEQYINICDVQLM